MSSPQESAGVVRMGPQEESTGVCMGPQDDDQWDGVGAGDVRGGALGAAASIAVRMGSAKKGR